MRRIQIFRLNPPSKGIFIRQRVGHPRIGYAWHEKRVYTKNGLLTSTETAAFLNVGLRRIYQLIEKEDLKPLRKGGQLLFSLRSLIQFEAKRRKPGRRKIREEAFLAG
jgi:hypothetical protein